MGRKSTSTEVQRRLYAESMGRCMNPNCEKNLFMDSGDIIEKAHITPYCDTVDNSFENLIILCPNCHTNLDKNSVFSIEELKKWKQIRKEQIDKIFNKNYKTFDDLKDKIFPLLLENKIIYENYFLKKNKILWDKFEYKVLLNNEKLKKILENNFNLFQKHENNNYSNLHLINLFLFHIEEFKATRSDEEKIREVLFPEGINSIFGIEPTKENFFPSVDSLEELILKLKDENNFISLSIGNNNPYIELKNNKGIIEKIFLHDTPRLRQLYYSYNCFRTTKVRLESLNYALQYIVSRGLEFKFLDYSNLKEILVKNIKIIFVYEYCLSYMSLMNLCLTPDSVIVNLHNWNGDGCISKDAYSHSEQINVTLLTMENFYAYINKIK